MRAKLEGIGIRMQELARKKLFQNRWLNPVPETFQGWARHIRQQRDYRNTVRRTLRQYMLRRRALSFRRWVSFAEEVIDARLNLQSKLTAKEWSGASGSRQTGGHAFARWWSVRAAAVAKRVKALLVDLVTEAHAWRQDLSLNDSWAIPLTPQRNIEGVWTLESAPAAADEAELEAAVLTDGGSVANSPVSGAGALRARAGAALLSSASPSPAAALKAWSSPSPSVRRASSRRGVASPSPARAPRARRATGEEEAPGGKAVSCAFRIWIA